MLSKKELDLAISEAVRLHFRETPYWVKYAKEHRISPRDIGSYEDFIYHVGPQPEGKLPRIVDGKFTVDPKLFKPKSLKEVFPSTSSGTTGPQKVVFWSKKSNETIVRYYDECLDLSDVPRNINWIIPGPEGLYRVHLERVMKERGGKAFFIPVETRGLKRKLMEGKREEIMRHFDPMLERVEEIVSQEEIGGIVVVPFIIPLLQERGLFEKMNLRAMAFGGMEMSPEVLANLKRGFGLKVVGWYGHFLLGPCFHFDDGSNNLNYFPNPLVKVDVVDEDGELVPYGEEGRLRITRFGDDILWTQLENDFAKRIKPRRDLDIHLDGFSNVHRKL